MLIGKFTRWNFLMSIVLIASGSLSSIAQIGNSAEAEAESRIASSDFARPKSKTMRFEFQCPDYEVKFSYSNDALFNRGSVESVSIGNRKLKDIDREKISKFIRDTGEFQRVRVRCNVNGRNNVTRLLVRVLPPNGEDRIVSEFTIDNGVIISSLLN